MDTWMLRENQNGSNSLTHYGIKGMKWGVRRTPEQLGYKSANEYSFTDKEGNAFTASFGKNNKGNYEVTISSKSEAYGFRTATVTQNDNGKYEVKVKDQSGGSSFSTIVSGDNYEEILDSLGYSEEEAEELVTDTVLNLMEENGIEYDREDLKKELKKFEEKMNKYRAIKKKIEDGISKVKSILKSIGNKIAKSVKSGKEWIENLFSKGNNKSPSTSIISKKTYVDQKWKTYDNVSLPYTPSSYYYNGLSKHPKPKN